MSEYVEKCPCCNNHSLAVTQPDWGEECEALTPFGPATKLEDVVETCGSG